MLTIEEFNKLCFLAKIEVPEQERLSFIEKLNNVFEWVQQLQKIDTSNVAINDIEAVHERPDEMDSADYKKDVFSNAKHLKFDMFSVPKVIRSVV